MSVILKAKMQLEKLKSRTQNDLYHLNYESDDTISYTPLSEDVLYSLRAICKDRLITCPIFKYNGVVKMKELDGDLYDSLSLLASDYQIYFNIKKHRVDSYI